MGPIGVWRCHRIICSIWTYLASRHCAIQQVSWLHSPFTNRIRLQMTWLNCHTRYSKMDLFAQCQETNIAYSNPFKRIANYFQFIRIWFRSTIHWSLCTKAPSFEIPRNLDLINSNREKNMKTVIGTAFKQK